ncbi:MAG: Gldg family protein [Deltaproteobacteria bacterium]|nr:Gldg family protein [Deltaproteobacteria bacterium]MBK8718322.1 Gldg family protein [Deltaproteobacteria bacterium]MBP7290990.1 Gldg family protein [Nannocystaceae bacterium]
MSLSSLLYLVGMAALFAGQRLFDGNDAVQWTASLAGLGAIVVAAVLRLQGLRGAKDEGLRFGHRVAMICLVTGVASLVMYAATTEGVVRSLTLSQDSEERWLGVWRSLWPIVWLLGTVPMMVVDYAIVSSPVMMPARRIRDMVGHGVVAALGLALVFPVNYIASKKNERWDLAYFKTPLPGTATMAIVSSLEQPVHVRVFMPPSSDVARELAAYFGALEGPNVTVEVIDQAAEPRLAKALSVRDNGTIAFTQGELDLDEVEPTPAQGETPAAEAEDDGKPKPVTRTLKVATDLEKAKRTLKKLDAEVQTILRELGHGERVVYFTTGHGELGWDGGAQAPVDREISAFKGRLKQLGFNVKQLGISQGLAEKVPDDADLVIAMGPLKQLHQTEVDALRAYVDAGGSLLVALDPVALREPIVGAGDPLYDLLAYLGVSVGDGVLASEQGIVPITHNKLDRFNLVTDGFSQHPSTTTLSQRANNNVLFARMAAPLDEVDEHASKVVFTVRTLAVVWSDLDRNAEYDADAGEAKNARNLVAAIEGGSEGAPWRAVVMSSSSIFSDLGVGFLGNQRLIDDACNWLIGAEALSGTTESEEDVKIEHTKEGQTTWFYLTVLGVPLLVLAIGGVRMRLRRRGGAR